MQTKTNKVGIVSSSHPLISESGKKILEERGNAMDACIVMAITSSVVLPDMCGIGGDGFLLYYDQKTKNITAITGSGWTGENYNIQLYKSLGYEKVLHDGILSISIPGLMSLLQLAYDEFGSMPISRYFDDGINLSKYGFPCSHRTKRSLKSRSAFLEKYPLVREFYDKDEITNPLLANFLEILSKSSFDNFYKLIAQYSLEELNALGAKFTSKDFLNFKAEIKDPITIDYRGYSVIQTPLPSQGFVQLNLMKILENFDLKNMSDTEFIHTLVEANKVSFENRSIKFKNESSIEDILSKNQVSIDKEKIKSRARSSILNSISSHTTSFVAIDHEGNVCSFITSISDVFGSGIFDSNFGFLYNNRLGTNMSLDENDINRVEPRKQPISTIHCYLVTKNKELVMAGGIPGGDYQPLWNTQIITRILDRNQLPHVAVNDYRFQIENNSNPYNRNSNDLVKIENKVPKEVIQHLKSMGHDIEVVEKLSGSAQVLYLVDNEIFVGYDLRTESISMEAVYKK